MEKKIVNNYYYKSWAGLPMVTATSGTPDQIFRCNDNTLFKPTLIVVTSQESGNQRLLLVDSDETDSGEDTNNAVTKEVFEFWCTANATTTVAESGGDIPIPKGLQFQYGVAGYMLTATGSGCSVYIEGYEIPQSTTE